MTEQLRNEALEVFQAEIQHLKKEAYQDELLSLFLRVLEAVNSLKEQMDPSSYKRKLALRQLVELTVGEHEFYRIQREEEISDEQLCYKISNKFICFLISSQSEEHKKGMKPYDHLVSTLVSATMALESINEPLARHDPNFSLMNDLFETTFKKISGFTKMLVLGLYMDAYVAWRTIHESESTLYLLVNNSDKAKFSYVKHIVYSNMYYNPNSFDDDQRDAVFEHEIKREMQEHGLKSKDMKKFLEYGWLYDCKEYDMEKHPKFKLNFNDGVDELSGLRDQYNEFYRGTSEISHSSSIFFYANEDAIKEVALMLTYESSYRIFCLYMQFMDEYFKRHEDQKQIVEISNTDVKIVAQHLRKKYEEE